MNGDIWQLTEKGMTIPFTTTPNGLDVIDLKKMAAILNSLDGNGVEFDGIADIYSNDRTISVRIWHDEEGHRLEVLSS